MLRMRSNAGLGKLYRLLPSGFRALVARFFWRRLASGLIFPPLPPVEKLVDSKSVEATMPLSCDRPGLNIYGYFGGQFGLGESARLYAAALAAEGIPVSVTDLDFNLPHHRHEYELRRGQTGGAPHTVDLICVNPDYLSQAIPYLEKDDGVSRYRIASWFWELDAVPKDWHWAFDVIDEIMVASEFVEQAFRKVTDKPLLRAPLPIVDADDSGLSRRDFGLPEGAFVFLSSFDFHSSIHRKNPEAVIAAFSQAFASGDEDVVLVIKSSNGAMYPEMLSGLAALARRDPRILIRDQVIDAAHMRSLQRCADAFISLHRAEGFGLGLAECMALGKPVVATAWSGNMEFMSEDTSCLVDYALVPVTEGAYLSASQGHWAEPDIAHASRYMRRLVSDPEFARSVGARASAHVRHLLSSERIARIVSDRLLVLDAERSAGVAREAADHAARKHPC